jgi:hypothetical protein
MLNPTSSRREGERKDAISTVVGLALLDLAASGTPTPVLGRQNIIFLLAKKLDASHQM